MDEPTQEIPVRRPYWTRFAEESAELRQRAEDLETVARTLRCPVRLDGGRRCTADTLPVHVHRYRERELPQ